MQVARFQTVLKGIPSATVPCLQFSPALACAGRDWRTWNSARSRARCRWVIVDLAGKMGRITDAGGWAASWQACQTTLLVIGSSAVDVFRSRVQASLARVRVSRHGSGRVPARDCSCDPALLATGAFFPSPRSDARTWKAAASSLSGSGTVLPQVGRTVTGTMRFTVSRVAGGGSIVAPNRTGTGAACARTSQSRRRRGRLPWSRVVSIRQQLRPEFRAARMDGAANPAQGEGRTGVATLVSFRQACVTAANPPC